MSLRYAVLASLLDGEASGYELGKRMDVSVVNYWRASRQQIYAELNRLHRDGLADARDELQSGRPNKRVYTITRAGKAALRDFTVQPSRSHAIKDELLIKVQAADIGDLPAVIAGLEMRHTECADRLEIYEHLIESYRRGRSEDDYLASARRIGPYLNLRRGRDFEKENLAWLEWATKALRNRLARTSPARAKRP
ncbi:MAG: helix-turn-helix transcriptional regulator [Nocardioides sp.]|uniref:PadR family transcriptional regulator n=1 Tax=Nocardioides sp. TaxID=35761 RepID=UPI0039E2B760